MSLIIIGTKSKDKTYQHSCICPQMKGICIHKFPSTLYNQSLSLTIIGTKAEDKTYQHSCICPQMKGICIHKFSRCIIPVYLSFSHSSSSAQKNRFYKTYQHSCIWPQKNGICIHKFSGSQSTPFLSTHSSNVWNNRRNILSLISTSYMTSTLHLGLNSELFTSVTVFILYLFIILYWSRSPCIVQQPQSV